MKEQKLIAACQRSRISNREVRVEIYTSKVRELFVYENGYLIEFSTIKYYGLDIFIPDSTIPLYEEL